MRWLLVNRFRRILISLFLGSICVHLVEMYIGTGNLPLFTQSIRMAQTIITDFLGGSDNPRTSFARRNVGDVFQTRQKV